MLTVGVLRCVLDRMMSKKSVAVGTGAILFRLFVVAIFYLFDHGDGTGTEREREIPGKGKIF